MSNWWPAGIKTITMTPAIKPVVAHGRSGERKTLLHAVSQIA
jgi:hypothetical protein